MVYLCHNSNLSTWNGDEIMHALQEIEQLLTTLTRAEKAQVLQWVVRDLGEAFPGIESTPGVCGGEPCIVPTRIPAPLHSIAAGELRPTGENTGNNPKSLRCGPSGYSRRGNRSPRLCFRTVRASFPAHGSSRVWCLSRIPSAVFSRLCIVAVSMEELPVVVRILPAVFFGNDVIFFQHVSHLIVQSASGTLSLLSLE